MSDFRPLLAPDAPVPPRPHKNGVAAIERLMQKTTPHPSGCWIFRGALNPKGYASSFWVSPSEGRMAAHRYVYQLAHGPIPDGLEIDHTCLVRNCLNPAHLRVVTHLENVRHGRTNQNDGKTHCHQGHAFDEANTYWLRGARACRACSRESQARYRARKAVAA